MSGMKRLLLPALLAASAGCFGDAGGSARRPREALFVGVDVSGSFAPYREDALDFLAYYIHGRLNGYGKLAPLKALFVGAIGGDASEGDDPKSFRPIQAFEGKSVDQIRADLKAWFPRADRVTDFSVFFKQAATIAQKRNLAMSPISVTVISDGIPALPGAEGAAEVGRYDKINLEPLEFLSRKVTVRLLYGEPRTCSKWEADIKRTRVRMWTVDAAVMTGWKGQLEDGRPLAQQERLWNWISENVDYRVRPVKIRLGSNPR